MIWSFCVEGKVCYWMFVFGSDDFIWCGVVLEWWYGFGCIFCVVWDFGGWFEYCNGSCGLVVCWYMFVEVFCWFVDGVSGWLFKFGCFLWDYVDC